MNSLNLLVAANETDGRFAVIEAQERPGSELPLHIHHNEDEFIYVLAGELTMAIGHERFAAGAGAWYFLPRGTEHGYAVTSDEARLLITLTPAGLETFLQAVRSGEGVDIEALISHAAHHALEITGELWADDESPEILPE
jgi:quercetin dioxygenase-like cupin family protein